MKDISIEEALYKLKKLKNRLLSSISTEDFIYILRRSREYYMYISSHVDKDNIKEVSIYEEAKEVFMFINHYALY